MKHPPLRILLPAGGIGILLGLVIATIGYSKFRISRFTKFGDDAVANGSWQGAVFWYGRVLEKDPDNRYVVRQLSENATLFRDPSELRWWQKRLSLEPESDEVRQALIKAFLRANLPEEAKQILDQSDHQNHTELGYDNLVTAYYLLKGNYPEAENHARIALSHHPESVASKLSLLDALLRLGNGKSEEEINQLVVDISSRQENIPDLLRTLIAYSASKGDWRQSAENYQKLLDLPDAQWYERLQYIKLLINHSPRQIPGALERLTDVPPILLETVCRELTLNNLAGEAITWLDNLETRFDTTSLSYQISRADALSNLSRWDDLRQYLMDLDWDYFDYYRYALMALACQQTERNLESDRDWKLALKLSYQNVQEQFRLATIVEVWPSFESQWISQLEDMLLHSVHTRWIYEKLHRYYFEKASTQDLYRISFRAFKKLPDDELLSNVIQYSLLLNQDLTKQLIDAKSFYDRRGNTPLATSTYAFALYKNRQYQEAFETIQNLDSRYYEIPEIAYYAAIIAKSAGENQMADDYFLKSENALLLPEEKRLSVSF